LATVAPYICPCGNPTIKGIPLSNYQSECYCKFSDAACQFDKFTCTATDANVAADQFSSHLKGGLNVKTDNPLERKLNCNAMFLMRLGLDFTATVVVCGSEVVNAIGSTVLMEFKTTLVGS
jgi:hypothetical protein